MCKRLLAVDVGDRPRAMAPRLGHQGTRGLAPHGAPLFLELIPAKRGWKINPARRERRNLECRQHVAAIGRRVNTLWKHEAGLRQQLARFYTYHNVVLPPASLRVPRPERDAIAEAGALKRGHLRPPALAVGLTHRGWSVRAVLRDRVPPWPQWSEPEGLGNSERGACERKPCVCQPTRVAAGGRDHPIENWLRGEWRAGDRTWGRPDG